mgnify:CR=1 FL=1
MGYVKLNRNLSHWEWFGNNNALLVLVRLTLKAAWRDTLYQGVALKRGQVVTTLQEIANENQLTKLQARTTLERLEATHKITRTATKKFSIITLLDYDCFFENNTQNSTQITHEQHAEQHSNNTPTLLKEESKKKQEVRKEEGACAPEPAPSQKIDRDYLVEIYGEETVTLYEQKFWNWGKLSEISYPLIAQWLIRDRMPKAGVEMHASSIDMDDVMQGLVKQYSEGG